MYTSDHSYWKREQKKILMVEGDQNFVTSTSLRYTANVERIYVYIHKHKMISKMHLTQKNKNHWFFSFKLIVQLVKIVIILPLKKEVQTQIF